MLQYDFNIYIISSGFPGLFNQEWGISIAAAAEIIHQLLVTKRKPGDFFLLIWASFLISLNVMAECPIQF